MCDCDCERPEVYREETPRARKPHRCCECRRVINPGEQYHVAFGVWNGDPRRFKWCAQCHALRVTLDESGGCACFGELLDVAYETGIACPVAWRAYLIEEAAEAR